MSATQAVVHAVETVIDNRWLRKELRRTRDEAAAVDQVIEKVVHICEIAKASNSLIYPGIILDLFEVDPEFDELW